MKIYHVEIYDCDLQPVREVRVEADNANQAQKIAEHCYLWAGEFVGYVNLAYGE